MASTKLIPQRALKRFVYGFFFSLLSLQAGPVLAAANALQTAEVVKQTLSREFRLDGVVEAIHKATVSAQTRGTIREILVDVDDYVEKGAVIIRLKDVSQRARLKKAQAGEQEAISHLAKAED